MRKITYLTAALFALGLVFVVSNSYSQQWEEYYGAQITGYSFSPMAWDTFDARGVLGTDLRNSDGSVIGHVDDFVIDPATGRISFLMVSDVQWLGAERVAVPFSAISKSGSSILVYNPPEDYQLQYGVAPYWSYGFDRYLGGPIPAGAYETNRMFGATVWTSDGEEAGRIDNFVFDSSDGHVVFLVLTDVGGTEDRMAAVPFGALSKSGDTFAINITKDRLMTAPAFAWSNTADRRYAEDINRYYGLHPYWDMREEVEPSQGVYEGFDPGEGVYYDE
jgi:sporulation protein YlmC with PRC-barrel domain